MAKHMLTQPRMAELSAIAGFYTSTYCSEQGLIDPNLIATSQGLKYSLNDYKEAFDGLLENINGKFHIYLNSANQGHIHLPRVRFSFAHELGHYLIPEHYKALCNPNMKPQPSFQTFNTDNKYEVEADYFAACLLMPEDRIQYDIYKKKFSFALIDEIARKYNVSLTAALIRFIGIGNYPIMIVCTRSKKIQWVRYTTDFPFVILNTKADGSVNENTSVGEFFYEGIKNIHKTETVFAGDWFRIYKAEDKRRPMKEYCIYHEQINQVISLIWE